MPDDASADAVKEILSQELGTPMAELVPEAHLLVDLNMDALDNISIVLRLQEHFNLAEISDEAAEKFQTVGDVIRYVREHQITEHL